MAAEIPAWVVVMISLVSAILFLYVAKHFYQQHMQRKMQDEVRNILCEYLPLEEFEAQAEARKKAFSHVNPMHSERKTEMNLKARDMPTVRYEDVSTVV